MPVSYRIDPDAEMVYSDGSGCITDAEILSHQNAVRSDPLFKPHFRQLFDLRAVTSVEISAEMIHQLARTNPFAPGSRRAAVAADPVVFGLVRMFEMLTDKGLEGVGTFTDMDAARRWLALD
jgi:hypothetical protein